jgi:histidyl-tRNA synthetase
VTGGGRYDNLFQEIGGLDIPGIGFAVGVERLISLLPKEREFVRHPHLFVAAMGEESYRKAYQLMNQLHLEGLWAELDYERRSLKSQMRRADKLKARYTLILGEGEIRKGKAVLRNMEDKSQEEILIHDLLTVLKEKIRRN